MPKLATALIALTLALALTACRAGAPTATPAANGALPANMATARCPLSQLLVGTFRLEGQPQAVTAEQAPQLALLWRGYRALSQSDATALELQSLQKQLYEAMTAEQLEAIAGLRLTAQDMMALMAEQGVEAATAILAGKPIDCVILGSPAAVATPAVLAAEIERRGGDDPLPLIFYDGGVESLTAEWRELEHRVPTVRKVQSLERLLDQSVLFLHRDVACLAEAKRRILVELHQSDKLLAGRKVLIVDDDMRNIFALSAVIEEHEMTVISADNGRDAIRILQEQPDIDIVLMDIMMPEMDGYEFMRAHRAERLPGAIIVLTARVDDADAVLGLELGADDYVTKPFSPRVLVARVRAVLRRTGAQPPAAQVLRAGAVVVDRSAHAVTVGGHSIDLTPSEFDLLSALISAPGRVFSRLGPRNTSGWCSNMSSR